MVVLADRYGVAISLTVAAASGFVGGVRDRDLSLPREEKDVGAHFLPLLRGGSDHNRVGVFEGASIRVWIEEPSGGDLKTFGVEDGRSEVDYQPFGVTGKVAEG